jgi:hypothetical protein
MLFVTCAEYNWRGLYREMPAYEHFPKGAEIKNNNANNTIMGTPGIK